MQRIVMRAQNSSVFRHFDALERRTMFSVELAKLSPDVVVQWNNVLLETIARDSTMPGPGWASRSAAMVEGAVFDAVNSIDKSASPLLASVQAPRKASIEAAAVSAAYNTLLGLYPSQSITLDTLYASSISKIKATATSIADGVAVGQQTAANMLAARASDGSNVSVSYVPDGQPGHWEPDPLNPGQIAWGPNWGDVTPFTMTSAGQFLPPRPPSMTSAEYTAAFNEVKSLGEKTSTTRTAEQTEIGYFWAYDIQKRGTPVALYDQIVQTIAQQNRNTLVQNARLFALANVAMADAGIAAWECKYIDNLWRPITAIRRADEDGNADTTADPNWVPLGAPGDGYVPDFTPPFPAYTSGHATFGGALFQVLRDFYGTNNMRFTLSSDELPGVTRTYKHFTDAAAENGRSRIYLGIHWAFDATEGQNCGKSVGDYIFSQVAVKLVAAAPAPSPTGLLSINGQVDTQPLPDDLTGI